jgi:uncharacterized protein YkuJ
MKTQLKTIFNKLVSLGATYKKHKSYINTKNLSKDEVVLAKTKYSDLNQMFYLKDLADTKQRIFEQNKLEAGKLKVSVKKYLELKDKAYDVAKCYCMGYSMGNLIEVSVKVKDKTFTLNSFDTRDEYASSSKYKAIHGYYDIVLTVNELDSIQVIGGIPTIVLSKEKIAPCKCLLSNGNKNHFKIEMEDMFLTETFHGNTIESCQNWRGRETIKLKKDRIDKYSEQVKEEIKQKKLKRFIGFQHSINVGNCETGTKMFAQKYGLDISLGYSLDYLVSLEPNNVYLFYLFLI